MSFTFKVWGLFIKVDDRLVLLSSMSGDQFDGSPKVLFEAMKIDSRFKGYHFVWAFSNTNLHNIKGATKVRIDTLEYFKTALRAKIWITDVNIERGLHFKKHNQIYLNTWHGTGPKKGGNAVNGRKDYDFSYVDIWCCDGNYTKDMFLKYWNAKEENMLMCGRPREDELFQFGPKDKEIIRNELGLPVDKKVILYMPTWREYGNRELNWDLWEKELKDDYVVLLRAHHFSDSNTFLKSKTNFWYDASNHSNVNRLYFLADILVSDYSSAFFDYGLLGKPMICYAYDYDKFNEITGLFMNLREEFPNGVMETESDVIKKIQTMDYQVESRKCKFYCESYVKHSYNATECCLNRLYELSI